MARYVTHPAKRSFVAGGFVAGLIGAVLMHAFLFAVGVIHYPSYYDRIAAGIVGWSVDPQSAALLGIIIHFAIAVVAAIVYAYVGQVTGLLGKPILGAMLFGIVMNGIMDLVVYARGLGPLPATWHDVIIGLIAHIVFFAAPIAFFLTKYERVPLPYV